MKISIFTLTSPIGDKEVIERSSMAFLQEVIEESKLEFELKGDDFSDYDQVEMPVIFVRTGGTEGLFKKVLPKVKGYVRLLTSGMSNSLAASMEILSFLENEGRRGVIIHGSTAYIARQLRIDARVEYARKALQGLKLGVIGEPSDWLISSHVDREVVREKLGIELVDVPISEVVDAFHEVRTDSEEWNTLMQQERVLHFDKHTPKNLVQYREGAFKIYLALNHVVKKHGLGGFTLRCFDLLSLVKNTGCMSLAMFNSRGIIASCEGDIPAMLTMAVGNALTGYSGFQSNPSRIDVEKGEITFAHCTVPFNMVKKVNYDTHFESGIGIGVKGDFELGEATIAKLSGDLKRKYFQKVELVKNTSERNLCRTQIILRGDDFEKYFLTSPIGNHHVIFEGDQTPLFESFWKLIH